MQAVLVVSMYLIQIYAEGKLGWGEGVGSRMS